MYYRSYHESSLPHRLEGIVSGANQSIVRPMKNGRSLVALEQRQVLAGVLEFHRLSPC